MNRHVGVLLMVALLALAGCAGLGAGGGGDAQLAAGDGGDDGAQDGAAAPESTDGEQATLQGRPLQTDRAIVRTGSMRLRVDDVETTRADLVDHARSLGGYVSAADSTRHTEGDESWTTGQVVVRVPSGEFAAMQSFARDRGTVLDEHTETEDVTEELVDLEARLNNSLERRERLRSFYERADTTEELLSIESELSSVQERIERLQGRLRSLRDRVAFSTLRIRLLEPEAAGGAVAAESTLVAAFLESAGTAVDTLYGIVRFGVVLAPYLVLFGLPAVAVGAFARRRYGWRVPRPGDATAADRPRESASTDRSERGRSEDPSGPEER
jgi:hypothetical protein